MNHKIADPCDCFFFFFFFVNTVYVPLLHWNRTRIKAETSTQKITCNLAALHTYYIHLRKRRIESKAVRRTDSLCMELCSQTSHRDIEPANYDERKKKKMKNLPAAAACCLYNDDDDDGLPLPLLFCQATREQQPVLAIEMPQTTTTPTTTAISATHVAMSVFLEKQRSKTTFLKFISCIQNAKRKTWFR